MIRRSFRILLWLGLLIGLGAILMRFLRTRTPDSALDIGTPPVLPRSQAPPWPPLAVAETPASRPAPVAWVDPDGRICPPTHPIKAKLSSGIFHIPGGVNYERTNPERCYLDAAAAEADGLRPSKR